MNIGIIGAGINGLCTALELAKQGNMVTIYERNLVMSQTSRNSSKLLHGGLRYLENFEFRLVREALKERDNWLKIAPKYTKKIKFFLPLYNLSLRKRWKIKIGLFLYDLFSRKSLLPKSKWLDRQEALIKNPELNSNGLIGGYEYYDVQMDDYALGMWVAKNAKKKGVKILSNQEVLRVTSDGLLQLTNEMIQHDYVINLAGPWALKLLEDSKIKIPYKLDIVRGSHLIIDYEIENSYILEVPNERRIFFVLPWKNKTLIGTTECRQDIKDKIFCSKNEIEYLINSFRFYFKNIDIKIIDSFSGLRPLIYSHKDPNKATREYVILRDGKLINVLGGKWTTSMALAKKVAAMINK